MTVLQIWVRPRSATVRAGIKHERRCEFTMRVALLLFCCCCVAIRIGGFGRRIERNAMRELRPSRRLPRTTALSIARTAPPIHSFGRRERIEE
ncbi:hypothetical protein PHSY_000232 [Pseudozyma hubeiensis SY62]|uniref:Uncharacterized protein n=1 Tax=Pseudozyma hubeiensis (strain SY62) TaxID=1305764 RepID=R9NW51_PSEHS|nr:hypothetical protein PHSY_000232 [Pseudozyma hubeiensis SY62]GAC92677.1 hypothetical protein PHSY_000232 [Pseudozyma hubeiensis SY62]